jgi:hypothetical protein
MNTTHLRAAFSKRRWITRSGSVGVGSARSPLGRGCGRSEPQKGSGDFFPKDTAGLVHAYIFARTVPCPNIGHMTPLVSDWHLLKAKSGILVVAVPVVDKTAGTWTTQIRPVAIGPGHIKEAPARTFTRGKGISLFTGEPIPAEWIKAKALAGEMGSALYAVALKTPQGLNSARQFQPISTL